MAWRWQLLLRAKGVQDNLVWLTRAYFVSYAAGQILPTSVGGDAVRIYETARRHPGHGDTGAATVLLERAIGGAATLILAAVGLALALGHYDVGAYLWIEALFVVATIAARLPPLLAARAAAAAARSAAARARPARPGSCARVYQAMHSYRDHAASCSTVLVVTLALQAVRVLAVWLSGKAVGIHLSPRPYYVMGPLLFLVMLVPFTVNGFAVRESFFVSFLGNLGVSADNAFAAGFLFFLVTILSPCRARDPRLGGHPRDEPAQVPREADG